MSMPEPADPRTDSAAPAGVPAAAPAGAPNGAPGGDSTATIPEDAGRTGPPLPVPLLWPAMLAFMLGVGSLLIADLGWLAVIAGGVVLFFAVRRPQRVVGRGFAIGAIALGLCGPLFVSPQLLPRLLSPLFRFGDAAQRDACASNLRHIGQALAQFARENDGQCPSNLQVLVGQGRVKAEQTRSPLAPPDQPRAGYSYVAGLRPGRDPGGWPQAWGDPQWSDGVGANVLTLDGQVHWRSKDELDADLEAWRAAYIATRGSTPRIVEPR
jgi:hypothetical protein